MSGVEATPPVSETAPFRLRAFATGSAPYAIGGVIGRAAGLLAVPIYLRHLAPDEFALQALALINEQVLVIVAGYAVTNAVGRFYANVSRGSSGEARVIRTALICVIVSAVGCALILQPFAHLIAGLTLERSPRGVAIVRLIGISFVGNAVLNLLLIILLLRQNAWSYVTIGGGVQTLAAAFSVVALVWFNGGLIGLVMGYALAIALGGVGAMAWLIAKYRGSFDRDLARQMIRYGVPLVPAALLMLIVNVTDRYALRAFRGLSEVGAYSAAFLIANAANLAVVTPFRLMWGSLMWNIRETPAERSIHRKILEHYLLAQALIIGGLVVIAPLALRLLSGNQATFVSKAPLVPLIYTGFVALGAADVLSAGYFFASRTSFHLRTVAITACVAIGMNLVLTPTLGAWGSAISYASSFVAFAIVAGIYGTPFFAAGFRWGLLMAHVAPVVLFALGAVMIQRMWAGTAGLAASTALLAITTAIVIRRGVSALRSGAQGTGKEVDDASG